ncbi:DUF4118 domain-containing protein [Alteromonas sp. KUL17]|uniref:sensor histidine kinase n=1 Tax=Alteromonas sp. KUL17 TaxID=2480796 RepID=UPI001037EDEC|nr:DUF4118 domain-containing protein [Alteromonas sp. KUL17]TAP24780.1 DUF4118 domain-containing protein [Alteromonas sp. KUL17]
MRDSTITVGIMGVFVLVCLLLRNLFLPIGGTLLILQLGAVTCTILFARVNGLIAALIGAFSFNFLFTEPFYSVRMTEFDDVINIATFLVVAILTSEFTAFYKRQQTALRKAQLQANVLRSVSHDLRTPLSTIIGSMETLDTYYYSLPEDDKRELIRGAIVESRRLHSYIENILQATKIQNDLLIAGREEVSVKLLIENVLIRFSNPRIVTSYSGHVRQIYASGPLLEQAIFNVIDNALKFSEQDVLVKVVSDSKSTTIAVEDSGIGLKDGDTERPFMLFSSSRDGDVGTGGIGLGLNVARGIAEAHKGKLVLESLTPGCRAIISIPNLSAKSS